MDTKQQALQQSLTNFNNMKTAVSQPATQPTQQPKQWSYIGQGLDFGKPFGETGLGTIPGMFGNFVVQSVQDIFNIPSNLIGGGIDISKGEYYKGAGRIGQGIFDAATTFFAPGKAIKGVKALKGAEALTTPGIKQIIKTGAKEGAIYGGISGGFQGLQQAQNVTPEQRFGTVASNIGLGAAGGALVGGGLAGLGGGYSRIFKPLQDETDTLNAFNRGETPATENFTVSKDGTFNINPISKDEYNFRGEGVVGKTKTQTLKTKEGKTETFEVPSPSKWNQIFAPVKELNFNIQNLFKDWVNQRKATFVQGLIKYKEFEDLAKLGRQGIIAFQKGESGKRFADVKKFFDDKYQLLKSKNVQLGYLDNYLPQLWADSSETVAETFSKPSNRRLTQQPEFTLSRIIEDYETGIAAGLTPRYDNIAQLIQWYEQTANKALADRDFFAKLISAGYIAPGGKAPSSWVDLSTNFPKYSTRVGTDKQVYQNYKASPELARVINNYLDTGRENLLRSVANYLSDVKQRMLTFGLANTGVNAHGINILVRNTLFSGNPLAGFGQAAYFLVNPKAAQRYIDANLNKMDFAIKAGLNVSAKDLADLTANKPDQYFNTKTLLQDKATKFGEKWNEWFEKPLFNQIIPALKTDKFYQVYDDLKVSMPEKDAARRAAEIVNGVFGGINVEQLGRSKETQDMIRLLLLAPDWFATNFYEIPKGVLKSFTDKEYKAYRTFARNMVFSYVSANVHNKMLSGHYMWENEPGQKFNIDTGMYDPTGKKIYVNLFGTAADFVRLPFDVFSGFLEGDNTRLQTIIRNRLSPALGTAISVVYNRDYLGRPILDKDIYGNPLAPEQEFLNVANVIQGAVGYPNFIQEGIRLYTDYLAGKPVNYTEAIAKSLEIPLRFKAETGELVRVQKDRDERRRELSDAIKNGDTAKANEISQSFTKKEVQNIISGLVERETKTGLNTQEKFIYSMSKGEIDELLKTNPDLAPSVDKVRYLKEQQKENTSFDNFLNMQFKPDETAGKGRTSFKSLSGKTSGTRARKGRKVRIKKPRIAKARKPKKIKETKIKKLKAIKI
jgi:hypothetical protein